MASRPSCITTDDLYAILSGVNEEIARRKKDGADTTALAKHREALLASLRDAARAPSDGA